MLSAYGIHKVRLDLPFRLDHVNCYAVQGDGGWRLVDAGLNYPPTRQGWLNFMKTNQINPHDIKGIYLTHYHPDHYGAAGWLQELTGAPVYISRTDAGQVQRFWLDRPEVEPEIQAYFAAQGTPDGLIKDISANGSILLQAVSPHPELTYLEDGARITLGNMVFTAVQTPGHSDGHLCFYNQEQGVLFSGDHLLPKITSNISLWPGCGANPLKSFFESLDLVAGLKPRYILPAHGDYFTHGQERVAELHRHHRDRLSLMQGHAAPGATAYDVCAGIFGTELDTHEMRFAILETIANLAYLVEAGELSRRMDGATVIYHLPEPAPDGPPSSR
jgi:glyoxylase-like metal-dependent hydrolase (beta-lactamase superfamily II)